MTATVASFQTNSTARFQPVIVLTAKQRDALKRAVHRALVDCPKEDEGAVYSLLNDLEGMI